MAFVIIAVIIFVLVVFIKGSDMGPRKPKVVDFDTLAMGRFKRYSPGSEKGTKNVHFKPDNSFFWEEEVITDVPEEAIIENVSAPDPTVKGICKEGYIILVRGHRGEGRVLEKIGLILGAGFENLRRRIKGLELDKIEAEEELMRAKEDVKDKIKEYNEIYKPMKNRESFLE